MKTYDVAVVGAGVIGCCIARELARYDLSVVVLEAGNDIACGATRANSGIVHAGFDPEPSSLKARFNTEGSRLFPQWSSELGFGYWPNGSMVIAFDEEEMAALQGLLERGKENGAVGELRLIDAEEALELEPNLSPLVKGALLVDGGAICDPYGTALAAAENAVANGVAFSFLSPVTRITCIDEPPAFEPNDPNASDASLAHDSNNASEDLPARDGDDILDGAGVGPHDDAQVTPTQTAPIRYRIDIAEGESLQVSAVVNAAGLFADTLNNMVSEEKITITPVRGEYCLYDPDFGGTFRRTIFQTPTKKGKGVLVSPTIHGNLFIGPTSDAQDAKSDLSTTEDGLAQLLEKGKKTWPAASKKGIITNFAGLRARGATGDFIIGEASDAPGFFNAACIESPGLSAAPAIATHLAQLVSRRLNAAPNSAFNPHRAPSRYFVQMSEGDRAAAIAEDPLWGNIACHCCKVTEAELVNALHGPLPVLSFDALKWRCGATMGPCHGGFCTPEIMTIVSRELGIPPTSLNKRLPGSWMAASSRENHAELARHSRKQHASAPRRTYYDVVVVGAGAAGMAAAKRASEQGASTLLLDRGTKAGGILLQCIHNGFGLHRFKEELTGPEYALREAAALGGNGPEFVAGATVLGIQLLGDAAGESGNTADHGNNHREGSSTHPQDTQPSGFLVQAACPGGMRSIETKSVVLATGSRERGLGTLNLPGSRPSGVYSAGSAQALINLQGCLPGKHAVVLGSGDIGLIMARRMTVEGMQVEGVYEIADRPSGLRRNIVQCLEDFDIPLHLSKTVTKLEGANRLEAVWVSEVDPATWQPIPGTEVRIPCDTLVLSIGLTPENELAKALGIEFDPITGGARVDDRMTTSIPGIYACGNALHIHDLADYASTEGDSAGSSAAQWALGESTESETLPVTSGGGVRYVVPQSIHTACGNATLSFRVSGAMRRPLFEIRGITKQGESRVISKTKSAVAVPAEMVRMSLNSQELGQFERIEVHAINRGEK